MGVFRIGVFTVYNFRKLLILTPSWVPRFPWNPLGGQNKHFTQLYNGLFDFVYFRISIIIMYYVATVWKI